MRFAAIKLGIFILVLGAAQAAEESREAAGALATAPGAADAPRFDIVEFRVRGNSLLDSRLIERVLYPFLGERKALPDVESARLALEQGYRDLGYVSVLVDIPEQEVKDGVVYLQVTEGRIESLRITGARYFLTQRIRQSMNALGLGNVVYSVGVQKQLGALNRASADRTVTPILRAGQQPGGVEAELHVADTLPLHGALELNDRYSPGTTRTRLSATLSYDNLWQREHSLSLYYETAPAKPKEAQVYAATYLAPWPDSAHIITAYAAHSSSDTVSVGTLGVLSNGDTYGLRDVVILETHDADTHSLTWGVDYKDLKENITLQGADALNTPISYYLFSVRYSLSSSQGEIANQYGLDLNLGVRGLNGDRIDCLGQDLNEFECKRHKATPNFAVLRASFEQQRPLGGWGQLFFKLEGQASAAVLISSEQYGAGGANSVRGYFESQQLGDDALLGSLEWRSPSFAPRWPEYVQELRALVFTDGAALRVRQPQPEQESTHELASTGIGARMQAWEHLNITFDWARVFKAAGDISAGDTRIHASVAWIF